MAAELSGLSITPTSSALFANLLRVTSLCPIIEIINMIFKEYWPQYQFLRYTTSDWPPLDFMSLITTAWSWQVSQFSVHFTVHLAKPYLISLSVRMLWETVSNALLKSR